MAFMRSQFSLVLLLAVIYAVTANEVSLEKWQDFLKDKHEYKSWCDIKNTQKCVGTNGKLNGTDPECAKMYFGLKALMEKHHFDLRFQTAKPVDHMIRNTTAFCSNAANVSSIFTASDKFVRITPGTYPRYFNTINSNTHLSAVTDITSNSTNKGSEDRNGGETNYLFWILSVVVMAMMVVGGIYMNPYAIKSGCHRSSKSDGMELENQ